MSTIHATLHWLETAGDRLNAILVKETRQALKSKQFVATFLLMLAASWLISVLGIMMAGPGVQYRETGGAFFAFYYIVLAFAIFIFVPFYAYRSLLNERELNTFELLNITTLSPRRIVWGKLQSAVVQLFIYYSAITPFIAFTYWLKGISVVMMAFVLVVSALLSIHTAMFTLMLSTFARQRHTQVIQMLFLLSWLFGGWMSSWNLVTAGVIIEVPFDRVETWFVLAVLFSYYIPLMVLYLQLATAQLTFESDNRTTGIRVTCSVLFWLSLGWMGLLVYLSQLSPRPAALAAFLDLTPQDLCVFAIMLAIGLAVVGLFAVTEDERLSRRIRRNLPRRRLCRILSLPFLPGGARGYLYVVAHIAAFCGLFALGVNLVRGAGSVTEGQALRFLTALSCYLLVYLGLGAFLGRVIRLASSDIRPAHARVLLVFMVLGGTILPNIMTLYDWRLWNRYPLLYITDPISTGNRLLSGTESLWTLPILVAAAVLALLINARVVYESIVEVLKKDPAPKAMEPAAAPEPLLARAN